MSDAGKHKVREMVAELVAGIPVQRDADAIPYPEQRRLCERRRAFLDLTCAAGDLVVRRNGWPMLREIHVGVMADGAWQTRIRYLAIDRDTDALGEIEATFEHDPDPRRPREPMRVTLARAVHTAIIEAHEHELAESMYYKGERLLDPHTEDP